MMSAVEGWLPEWERQKDIQRFSALATWWPGWVYERVFWRRRTKKKGRRFRQNCINEFRGPIIGKKEKDEGLRVV